MNSTGLITSIRIEEQIHLTSNGQGESCRQTLLNNPAVSRRSPAPVELRSIGDIARHQRLKDCDEESLGSKAMLTELGTDNRELARFLRMAHDVYEGAQRCRHCQLDRKLDRRDRAADVVFVRNIARFCAIINRARMMI